MTKRTIKSVSTGLGFCIIAGIILSILAPYGTNQMSVAARTSYWTILCIAGGLGASVFMPIANRLGFTPGRTPQIIGESISSSLLVTLILTGWNIYRSGPLSMISFISLFFFVWVIGVMITVFIHLAERARNPVLAPENKRAALIERLRPNLRNSDIYALTSEDHYVRVITSKGEDLILMRLSDAIKELGSIQGLTVHRSWWVAEAGVKSAIKSDGKISLELHSGQTAPVSRSNAKMVRDAGWVS